jgi:N-methylhydantoinase B
MYGWCGSAGGGLPDVELHEATDPVLFLWRRITKNSGGPGQRRGGQGLDQAYLLVGSASFAGFTNMACADFPPPGFGGGFPPAVSLHYPLRETDYFERLPGETRQALDEQALAGRREAIRKKVGHFVFNPGDALRAICGGGAGLGDPLLRSPDLVVTDIRDGYITIEHAQVAYGVVVDAAGAVDPVATDRCRMELRCSRIGRDPEREAMALDVPGLSVVFAENDEGRRWSCAYCNATIAPLDQDWRQASVRHEQPIAEFYGELGMQVRVREAPPAIKVTRFYCATCASCLTTDVATDRTEPGSPVIAAAAAVGQR